MTRAHIARVHRIVVEVLALECAGFVAHQAVLRDRRRIELHLQLHVLGDGEQRGAGFLDQHFLRLAQRVDIRRHSIAVLRQRLRQLIAVVALSESEHGQENAFRAFALDETLELVRAGDADVEVAVRGQEDAIHAALAEMGLGKLVRPLDTFGAGRRSTGAQFAQRLDDLLLVLHGRRLEHRTRGARVHHDAHGVGRLQARQQQLHRLDRQRQFVGRIHRAAHVEQQHQVGARRIVARDLVALDADVNQLAALAPGRVTNYYRRLERRLRGIRGRPRVVEVVDHLLDAHRILLWQAAGVQLPANEAVRRGIDVRRKRGHGLVGDLFDRVHVELLELVAAFVRNRHRGFVRKTSQCRYGGRRR